MPRLEIVDQVDEGSAALAMVTRERPALVLLGSGLPFEEAWMALKQVKAEWPQTLVHCHSRQYPTATHGPGGWR